MEVPDGLSRRHLLSTVALWLVRGQELCIRGACSRDLAIYPESGESWQEPLTVFKPLYTLSFMHLSCCCSGWL